MRPPKKRKFTGPQTQKDNKMHIFEVAKKIGLSLVGPLYTINTYERDENVGITFWRSFTILD